MHFVTAVQYAHDYVLLLQFEDGSVRRVDLQPHLDGEVFEALRDRTVFRTARLNPDLDTVVWDNGADMCPDFLYALGVPEPARPARAVAEGRGDYTSGTS